MKRIIRDKQHQEIRSIFSSETIRTAIYNCIFIFGLIFIDITYSDSIEEKDALVYAGLGLATIENLLGVTKSRMKVNDAFLQGNYNVLVTPEFLPGKSRTDLEIIELPEGESEE